MNWYKMAQDDFLTWFANESKGKTIDENDMIKLYQWAKETKPNFATTNFETAIEQARRYDTNKKYKEHFSKDLPESEKIKKHHDEAIADSQNTYPHAPNFMVDIRLPEHHIPSKNKKQVNNGIHDLGNYHEQIPLHSIFNILKENDIIPLQEDGTYWEGLLLGGKECGHEEAIKQRTIIPLAININGQYFPCSHGLFISWCKMPSGKYEIISYVN